MPIKAMFGLGLALVLGVQSAAAAARDDVARVFADIKADQPGCAIATVRNGGVDLAAGYGRADVEAGKPMTADTIMESASLSKQLTAFGILLLEKEGRLSLNDSVRKHIPELAAYMQPITVGDLMRHTAGLRDASILMMLQDNYRDIPDRESWPEPLILQILNRQRAGETPPGVEQIYNNTNYRLLAVVIERASGKTVPQFMSDAVFKPLGMTHTFVADAGPMDQLAPSYRISTAGAPLRLNATGAVVGAAGVRTTVNDFALWMENFWTAGVGGRDVLRRMGEVVPLRNGGHADYAGGLTRSAYRGLTRLEHGGSWDGMRHKMVIYPEQNFAAVILCNRADASATPRIDAVSDIYLADTVKAAKEETNEVLKLRAKGNLDVGKIAPGLYRDVIGAEYLRIGRNDAGVPTLEYRGETLPLRVAAPGVYTVGELKIFPGFALYVAFDRKGVRMAYGGDLDRFEPVEEWQPGDLSRYAGTYWSEEAHAHMTISVKAGVLYSQMLGLPEKLKPGRKGEFIFRRSALEVPADGPADRVVVRMYGLRGVVFERQ